MQKLGEAQPGASEGARRASGEAPGLGRGGRMSARRKREAVLRLLRGEELEAVSRSLGVTAATLSMWRDAFLVAGEASLKQRAADARAGRIKELQAQLGATIMDNELLRQKVARLEAGRPLARGRSRR